MSQPLTSVEYEDVTYKMFDLVRIVNSSYGGTMDEAEIGQIVELLDVRTVRIDFPNHKNWIAGISDLVLVKSRDKKQIEIDSKIRQITKDIISATEIDVHSIHTAIALENEKVAKLRQEMFDGYTNIRAMEKVYKSRKAQLVSPVNRENLEVAVNSLLSTNRYKSIEIMPDGFIQAITVDIVIQPHKYENWVEIKEAINLGSYTVVISPRIITISGGRKVISGYNHPHISGNNPCFGTYSDTIAYHHSLFNVVDLLYKIFDYLKAIDEHAWYIEIHNWLSDRDKRCGSCFLLSENCICNKCRECGEHQNDCTCDRCPGSDDIVHDYQEYCLNAADSPCRHASVDEDGNFQSCNY